MKTITNLLHSFFFKAITPGMFRFLLASIVVVYHSVDFLTIGHYAVYVFFMLSGYWIFKMYNEKYSRFRNSYWVYLISRLGRLMPMYWLLLLFSVLVYMSVPAIATKLEGLRGQGLSVGLYNFFVLGIADSFYQFIGTTWSLDIEIQFYILAPLLLFLCKGKGGWLLLALTSFLSILLILNHYKGVNILIYLPYFIIGGLIYTFQYIASRRLALAGILIAAGLLLISYIIPSLRNGYLLNREAFVLGFNYREGLNVILALLTIPFVSVNIRQTLGKEIAGKDQLWSSMSYVIYLLHWPLLQIYAVAVNGVSGKQKAISLLIYYITCFLLSYIISRYVDAYFEKQRRKWLHRQEEQQPVLKSV